MKFLVDVPLGGLVKWLRFCGFDTSARRLSPEAVTALPPPQPDTYILTRRKTLARLARPDVLILSGEDAASQLEEVFRRLGISPRNLRLLSRCSHCNTPLIPLARGQVQGRVPDHVFHCHREFYECPDCHRVFWPGSHLPGIVKTLQENLESGPHPVP